MASTKPVPEVTGANRPFWDAAADHTLSIQLCDNCQRYQHPPLVLCPTCEGQFKWVQASGRATLYTFTVFRQPYHSSFVDDVPYNVSVVELDEGPQMLTTVVGCEIDDLHIGMRLQATFDDRRDTVTLPRFAPIHDL